MTKLEDDGDFELQTKRWTKLIELRQTLTSHGFDTVNVDLAIANVFDPNKGQIIDSIIVDGKELMGVIPQLEELQIDSTNAKIALAKVFVPGASVTYAAELAKLKGMIEMREQMRGMGIPTGCIEAAISEIFKPLSAPSQVVKSEVSVTVQPPQMAKTELAELDSIDTATATTKPSNAQNGKHAELEASETVLTTQVLASTGACKPVESLSRPTETNSVSKDTETGKPVKMLSQTTAMKPPSPGAEHITVVGASIEAMDLDFTPVTTPPRLRKALSDLTSPSAVCPTPSTKIASSSSSSSTTRSQSSTKRSAPTDNALGSAQNPICLTFSPAPKRQRTTNTSQPEATVKRTESWKVPIQSVGIMGLHLKPRYDDTDISIVFDVETQCVIFYYGEQSLTALYPNLEINPEALLSVTRPTYAQSKQLRVRFVWLDSDAKETFLDIMIASKQDCRELIARLKDLTSFSEVLSSEPRMNKLDKEATWVVNETQNAVGLSVTRFSEDVWLD